MMSSPAKDDFFVGYLATPQGLRAFLRRTVALLLVTALTAAGLIASRQRDPGTGRWDDHEQTFEGLLIGHPYPMLQLADGSTLLRVAEGKHAAVPTLGEGRQVRAKGTIIDRSGLRMLEVTGELSPTSDRVGVIDPMITTAPPRSLRGQIVDPKCFLGGMKPGDGKTHKACAALCLRGGIPPAFISDGRFYLLIDQHGSSLAGESLDRAIAFVGDPVEITAAESTLAGIHLLLLDPSQIRRL
jgi:hypothetical protein